MHSLVDKEDEAEIVKENFKRFQNIYHPILQQEFKDCFAVEEGKLIINHDDATRRFLMSHINDNVYQNLNSKIISVRSYDKEDKFFKYALPQEQKMDIIDDIIKESKEKKVSSGAGDKKKDEAKVPSIFGDGAID